MDSKEAIENLGYKPAKKTKAKRVIKKAKPKDKKEKTKTEKKAEVEPKVKPVKELLEEGGTCVSCTEHVHAGGSLLCKQDNMNQKSKDDTCNRYHRWSR